MSFLISLFTGGFSGYYKIALYLALVFSGYYVEHLRFVHYVDEQTIVAQKQADDTAAKEKEAQLITKGVQDAYEARIANIHTMYGRMLNTRSGAVSSTPNATITVNGETHNVLSVAEECAATTQQLISLQDWVNQQIGLYERR
jgi:hypothetical protein